MDSNMDLNFNEIIKMVETRRNNAYRKVNEELYIGILENI